MTASIQTGYAPRMSLFFGAYFFPFGIYIPFFGVWLSSLGMDAEAIGLILTIPLITRVIFTPIMAAAADKLGDRRLTLRIYCFAYAASFALITLYDNLLWLCVVMAISHMAQSAIVPLADSLAMAGTRRYDLDYGRMRSWGSVSFMAANLAGGFVLDLLGASQIIWLMVIGNALHVLLSITLPVDPRLIDNKKLAKGTKLDWTQLRQFGQSGFWVILIAAGLLQSSHSMLYGFATIYWRDIGIAANMTGIFWSVSVLAEVLLFFFSKRLTKLVGWKILLLAGGLIGAVRWCLFPLDLPQSSYLMLQLLHAGSFGCTHLGTMFYIADAVDDELSGTAQGLFTMMSGLLMAAATFVSGFFYAQWAGDAFYSMGAISFIAFLLILTSSLFPSASIRVDSENEA